MEYHLNDNGHDLGKFPLEELQRRRALGALTGKELVWQPGMSSWEPLDQVLQKAGTPPLIPQNIPASGQKSGGRVALRVVMILLLILACVCLGIIKNALRHNRGELHLSQLFKGPGVVTASRPLVTGTSSMTVSNVAERDRLFRVRQYVDAYQEHGVRNPATDADALKLLEGWTTQDGPGTVHTIMPPFVELGDKLANDPNCTDPLVLSITAMNCVGMQEGAHRLERALAGFTNSQYSAYPQFYTALGLGLNVIGDKKLRLDDVDAQTVKLFQKALADGSIQPGDQAEIADLMLAFPGESFFGRHDDAIVSAVQERGKDFSWLALVLKGQQQINEAWKARGNGYANTVSSEQWSSFNEHLGEARETLMQAWQLRPDLPEAPQLMLTVALGNSDADEMRKWFDRTTVAQIDDIDAWKSMEWGLYPRWYGSYDAMLALGQVALDSKRFDTEVPHRYLAAVRAVESDMDLPARGEWLFGRDDIWPRLQEMYAGYIAASTGEKQKIWRSEYAVVAYLGGKRDVAAQQLAAQNWQLDHWTMCGWNSDLSLMAEELAARSSGISSQVNAAENCRHVNDFAGAIKIYQAIDTNTLPASVQDFVIQRLAQLDLERRLHAGGWVDFLPTTTNLAGWQVERGQCKLLPDGALEVQSDENGHLLYSRARIGPDFEVRGQYELVHTTDGQFQGGLVMGVPQFESQNWYAFRIKRLNMEGNVANFSLHWTTQQLLVPATINLDTNTFTFRYQRGKVTATVNGREVFHEVNPPDDTYVSTNDFHLGLGAFNDANATVIRYRKVQVHLLNGD